MEELWIGVEEDEDLDLEVGRSPGKELAKIIAQTLRKTGKTQDTLE